MHTATQTNAKATQNTGIVNTNRSHMMVILDSSFYSFPERSRCVFHCPPKKTRLRCRLLNVRAWPINESRQRDRSAAPTLCPLSTNWNLCQLRHICFIWQLTRRCLVINPIMVSLCSLRCPSLSQTSRVEYMFKGRDKWKDTIFNQFILWKMLNILSNCFKLFTQD